MTFLTVIGGRVLPLPPLLLIPLISIHSNAFVPNAPFKHLSIIVGIKNRYRVWLLPTHDDENDVHSNVEQATSKFQCFRGFEIQQ